MHHLNFEMKRKICLPVTLVAAIVTTTTACGGASDSSVFNDPISTGRSPWDTGGTLTLSEANRYTGNIESIVELSFDPSRERIDLADGVTPWSHSDGTLYYLTECAREARHVVALNTSGTSSVISPCSNTIANTGYSPTQFTHIMASPDQRRIAVEIRWYDRDLQSHHDTVIYEDDTVIATYEGFYAAAWIDNDSLIMPSADGGLYTVSLGTDPVLLSDVVAGGNDTYFNNPDVSPDGNQVVFEWNGAIWMMDINGNGLRELANDPQNLRFPVWSPDGQFVAFLRIEAPGAFDHLIIPGDPLNYSFLSTVTERKIHFVNVVTLERWFGNIEDDMAADKMPQGQLSWLPVSTLP